MLAVATLAGVPTGPRARLEDVLRCPVWGVLVPGVVSLSS